MQAYTFFIRYECPVSNGVARKNIELFKLDGISYKWTCRRLIHYMLYSSNAGQTFGNGKKVLWKGNFTKVVQYIRKEVVFRSRFIHVQQQNRRKIRFALLQSIQLLKTFYFRSPYSLIFTWKSIVRLAYQLSSFQHQYTSRTFEINSAKHRQEISFILFCNVLST